MRRSALLIPCLMIMLLLAACGGGGAGTQAAETETVDFTFTFIDGSVPQYLSLDDLKALPATQGMGGIMSSTGKISIPELYKGVSLKDLIAAYANGFDETIGVTLTAEDGYSMTYSYAQVMNGDFIAYDPALGTELAEHDPLTAILAYERNGEMLDPVQDGVLRVVIISERNNQVTDGHWSVKWINRMELESVSAGWDLELEGATLSPVSRDSFQSCGSPGCHGVEIQDETGATWTGVPLWLLIGEVDDGDQHSDFAYNDDLADSGYTVDVITSDGTLVTFDSISLKRNGDIVVAYLLNNSELPEKDYPLRLVGSGLESGQAVGQIVRIVVHVPAVSEEDVVSSVMGDLVVTGLVNIPLGLMETDLRASEHVVALSTEHPKDGMQDYEGIRFKTLFEWAGLKAEGLTIVLTASDGYSTGIPLADLQACEDCLVAFSDTPGILNAIMPGQASGLWIKDIVSVEVK